MRFEKPGEAEKVGNPLPDHDPAAHVPYLPSSSFLTTTGYDDFTKEIREEQEAAAKAAAEAEAAAAAEEAAAAEGEGSGDGDGDEKEEDE